MERWHVDYDINGDTEPWSEEPPFQPVEEPRPVNKDSIWVSERDRS